VLLGVYGIFWAQFSLVRADNFGGIDEWMILSLVSRGVIDIPYANRPLGLLFNLPVTFFPAHLLPASLLLHAHYLVLAGLLTSLLLLRLAPDRPDRALLAGAFTAVCAPSDLLRLDAIYSSAYAGVAAGTVLVLLLLAAGARRLVLVVVAAGLAFVLTRVHEGALPVLLLTPLLLRGLGVRLSRAALTVYYGLMGLALLVAGLPLVRGGSSSWYQRDVLGVYVDPVGVAGRLGRQFFLHVVPALGAVRRSVSEPHALAAAALLVLALALLEPPAERTARRFAPAILVGVLGAAAAYSGFVVAARMAADGNRTEMLAAPFIGLALAASVLLLGETVPEAARRPLVAILGVLVVAGSAARTSQLQRTWDRTSFFGRQAGTLEQMLRIAPAFEPDTLVVLFDGNQAWLGTFAFHHALDLAYGPGVAGCVGNGREEAFYACRMDGKGIHHDPWPALRSAWRASPRLYRFDEVVVLRSDSAGRLTLLEEWPPELPPLPAGAAYRPRARIAPPGMPPPGRAILSKLPPG
jgi:hypothetical protein